MAIYKLKRKSFTKYDDTDNLKRMKDSDILAEKKKTPGITGAHMATAGIGGALAGGAIGAGSGLVSGLRGKGYKIKGRGKTGLLVGAGLGLAAMASQRSKQKAENSWYNDRLEYAQRQARRREKADWKANMTQRDGYSY